jgi:preprotein translocase subunit SecG
MTLFLTIVFILIAVLLVLIVLVQRGRGGGLSGAFGAGGGSGSAFGTKTGDVFTMVTVVLFVCFMLMAIWLNYRYQSFKEVLQGAVTTAPVTAGGSDILPPIESPKIPATTAPATPTTPKPPAAPTSQPK